jgi:hypothetical protein
MRGAGARGTSTVARHLPPRPVESVNESSDRPKSTSAQTTTNGTGIRDGFVARHHVQPWVAAANESIAPGLLIEKPV